ncbi:dephospho-CoA kinase [uncultured Polaribacter sp.]|jgi:dephospho-CoA kinase|uniref:dephospho-CoA kinase n=1 Tax=uncultured Polaribacter sp. TaxID=174711 RepID=UPI0030DCB6FA|tara:strand:+ start:1602 stop:2201 length:600 start_codon:yes stop_codon:yes gene_type:complete
MIVGLTGGIGSGKTTVAEVFKKLDSVAVYIADIEARKIMNSSVVIRTQLLQAFGKETYKNNELNRQYLANTVFESEEKLTILNNIVHPEVKKHFLDFATRNADKSYVLYESAILFESNSSQQCDFIISVFLDKEERIKRVLERDKTTEKEVLSRINSQWKEDKKLLSSNYIIFNYAIQDTKKSVLKIHNILTEKALTIL